MMSDLAWTDSFLRLTPPSSLKRLEKPFLYHRGRDELYELDDRALEFLVRCDGSRRGGELTDDHEFVAYALAEGLLEILPRPEPVTNTVTTGATPSLRYLELQLTRACNLRCRHCYLGPPAPTSLALDDALAIARDFAAHGGLKLMISGGEPLLYPELQEFVSHCRDLPLRLVLLTNATLLNAENCRRLDVDEIQVSLDGWREGHELLRGTGNFARTLLGIEGARQAGRAVSLATMIHRGNLHEFERMRRYVEKINAVGWGIDILCEAGNLIRNQSLLVPLAEAVPLLNYAFGGGYHGPSEGFACGRHLLTVLPDGQAVKCGFYQNQSLGDARLGLIDCWNRLDHTPLAALACRDCPVLDDCGGGCRFRAPHPLAPDPVMCARHGIDPRTFPK